MVHETAAAKRTPITGNWLFNQSAKGALSECLENMLVEQLDRLFRSQFAGYVTYEKTVDDIVQDCLTYIWQKRAKFDPNRGGQFSTWCITVARNFLNTQYIRDKRRRPFSLQMSDDITIEKSVESDHSDIECREQIKRTIAGLPEELREVAKSLFFDDDGQINFSIERSAVKRVDPEYDVSKIESLTPQERTYYKYFRHRRRVIFREYIRPAFMKTGGEAVTGFCFEHFDVEAKACKNCLADFRKKCETATKRRIEKERKGDEDYGINEFFDLAAILFGAPKVHVEKLAKNGQEIVNYSYKNGVKVQQNKTTGQSIVAVNGKISPVFGKKVFGDEILDWVSESMKPDKKEEDYDDDD